MLIRCSIPSCTSDGRNYTVSFFSLPLGRGGGKAAIVRQHRRDLWLRAIGLTKDYSQVDHRSNIRVCHKHFVSGKPSPPYDIYDPDWVPTLNLNGIMELRLPDMIREVQSEIEASIMSTHAGEPTVKNGTQPELPSSSIETSSYQEAVKAVAISMQTVAGELFPKQDKRIFVLGIPKVPPIPEKYTKRTISRVTRRNVTPQVKPMRRYVKIRPKPYYPKAPKASTNTSSNISLLSPDFCNTSFHPSIAPTVNLAAQDSDIPAEVDPLAQLHVKLEKSDVSHIKTEPETVGAEESKDSNLLLQLDDFNIKEEPVDIKEEPLDFEEDPLHFDIKPECTSLASLSSLINGIPEVRDFCDVPDYILLQRIAVKDESGNKGREVNEEINSERCNQGIEGRSSTQRIVPNENIIDSCTEEPVSYIGDDGQFIYDHDYFRAPLELTSEQMDVVNGLVVSDHDYGLGRRGAPACAEIDFSLFCNICRKHMKDLKHYQTHMAKHRRLNHLVCSVCKTILMSSDYLNLHLIEHKAYCDRCQQQIPRVYLGEHRRVLRENTEAQYLCVLCNNTFSNEVTFNYHLAREHRIESQVKYYSAENRKSNLFVKNAQKELPGECS